MVETPKDQRFCIAKLSGGHSWIEEMTFRGGEMEVGWAQKVKLHLGERLRKGLIGGHEHGP